jgi:hypothetical protein
MTKEEIQQIALDVYREQERIKNQIERKVLVESDDFLDLFNDVINWMLKSTAISDTAPIKSYLEDELMQLLRRGYHTSHGRWERERFRLAQLALGYIRNT